jgi:hypothetical protein
LTVIFLGFFVSEVSHRQQGMDGRTSNSRIGQSENDKTALPNGITVVYIFYIKSNVFLHL